MTKPLTPAERKRNQRQRERERKLVAELAEADLRSPDWVPLNTALQRAKDSTGSVRLAANDLQQALLGGRLKATARLLNHQGIEERAALFPSYWEAVGLRVCEGGDVQILPLEADRVAPGELHVFVRRSDLNQLYPSAGSKDDGKVDRAEQPARRPGPRPKYKWHDIDGEIARRCVDPKTGRVRVPHNERRLAAAMLEWCQNKYGYGREPVESEMREAVKRMCAALRSLP
jgi:hypothetical protein